jgi:TPR repeat protein
MLIDVKYLEIYNRVKACAEDGDPLATSLIGDVFFDGIGTAKDEGKAIDYYRRSISLVHEYIDPLSNVLVEMEYYHLLRFLGFQHFYEGKLADAQTFLWDAFDFAFALNTKEEAKKMVQNDGTYSHLVQLGFHPEI